MSRVPSHVLNTDSCEENEVVERALLALQAGKVIAVPTDTIYGVACLAQSTEAVDALYEIKNRHREKAIAICVGDIQDVKKWGQVSVSDAILNDLLPGPVTLIFKKTEQLNCGLNPATDIIGIRIPNNDFIQTLARRCGQPIALTSANLSNAISSLQVSEFRELWPKLALVVDSGSLSDTEECRLGSTVVDLSVAGEYKIIRAGCAEQQVVSTLRGKHKLTQA